MCGLRVGSSPTRLRHGENRLISHLTSCAVGVKVGLPILLLVAERWIALGGDADGTPTEAWLSGNEGYDWRTGLWIPSRSR